MLTLTHVIQSVCGNDCVSVLGVCESDIERVSHECIEFIKCIYFFNYYYWAVLLSVE